MMVANHVLSGALIGTVFNQPLVAVPLALVSHFVLDLLPHFGFDDDVQRINQRRLFLIIAVADTLALLAAVVGLFWLNAGWLALACAFAAASPDLVWVYKFVVMENFGRRHAPYKNTFNRWHASLQKLEFKKGVLIEYPVFVMLGWAMLNMLSI